MAIVLANFVVNAVGFVVALLQKLDGVGNVWSWIPICVRHAAPDR